MVEVAEAQLAAGGDHVALVDAEPERPGEAETDEGGGYNECENGIASVERRKRRLCRVSMGIASPRVRGARNDRGRDGQPSITFCVCTPRPSTERRIVSPTFRNIGLGLTP